MRATSLGLRLAPPLRAPPAAVLSRLRRPLMHASSARAAVMRVQCVCALALCPSWDPAPMDTVQCVRTGTESAVGTQADTQGDPRRAGGAVSHLRSLTLSVDLVAKSFEITSASLLYPHPLIPCHLSSPLDAWGLWQSFASQDSETLTPVTITLAFAPSRPASTTRTMTQQQFATW